MLDMCECHLVCAASQDWVDHFPRKSARPTLLRRDSVVGNGRRLLTWYGGRKLRDLWPYCGVIKARDRGLC